MTCTCWEPPTAEISHCVEHYKFAKNGKQLTGITSVIRAVWPDKPDFSKAPADVLENARARGDEVDTLFTHYLNDTLNKIQVREDSEALPLFKTLVKWWEARSGQAQGQVVLSDDDLVGIVDILELGIGGVFELKTAYSLEPTYSLQLGGYCHLYEAQFGALPKECGIIHLTKRFAEPKFVAYDPLVVVSEFRTCLEFWRLWQSKSKRKSA